MKATTMLAVLAAAAVSSATPMPQQYGGDSDSTQSPSYSNGVPVSPDSKTPPPTWNTPSYDNGVPVSPESKTPPPTWNTPSYDNGVKPVPSYDNGSGPTKKQPDYSGGVPVPGQPGKFVDVPQYRKRPSDDGSWKTPQYDNGVTPNPGYGGDDDDGTHEPDSESPKYGNGVPPPKPVSPTHHQPKSCDSPPDSPTNKKPPTWNTPSYGNGVKPVPSYDNGSGPTKKQPDYSSGVPVPGQPDKFVDIPQYIEPQTANTHPKSTTPSTTTNTNDNDNDNDNDSSSESSSTQSQSQNVNVYNQPGVAPDAIPDGESKATISHDHINQVAGQCNAVNQQNNSTAACCVGEQKKVKKNSNDGLLSGLLDGLLEVSADGCTLNLKSGSCQQNTMACCATNTKGDDNSGKTSGITVIDLSHNCIPVALG